MCPRQPIARDAVSLQVSGAPSFRAFREHDPCLDKLGSTMRSSSESYQVLETGKAW